MMRGLAAAILFLVVFASPALGQTSDAALNARIKNMDAAMKAKDPGRLAALYADDAVLFSEGALTSEGRVEIREDYTQQFQRGLGDMTFRDTDVKTSGDLAYQYGTYSLASEGTVAGSRTGSYLLVWRRIGGQWWIVYDTFAAGPSGPPLR